MFYLERRNGYTGDIRWLQVYTNVLCCGILIIVIAFFTILIVHGDAASDYENQQRHNARVEEFNSLPRYKRVVLTEWHEYEVDEDYLQALEPKPSPFTERCRKILPYAIVITLIILSLATFWGYAEEKSRRYFFADYPWEGALSIIAFLLMWVCWPTLLVSYIRMRHWEKEQSAEKARREAEEAERAAEEAATHLNALNETEGENNTEEKEEDDDEHITYEDLSADHTNFAPDSCAQFIAYCQRDDQYKYEMHLQRISNDIEKYKRNLRNYGDEIRELQGKLKTAQLELEKLKRGGPPQPQDENVLITDWEAIKAMRGVTAIYYDDQEDELRINVVVRVPYNGEVYDFGDHTIIISYNKLRCIRERSGVREDWHNSGYPDYYHGNSGEFCFGSRHRRIEEYLEKHRLREAIILAIDCLHSVNDENDAKYIPDCFRRIVSPKEG